jgi:hypothetical protein
MSGLHRNNLKKSRVFLSHNNFTFKNKRNAKTRLRDHAPFIKCLLSANPELWNYTFNNLTDDQIEVLQDIVRNFLCNNIQVTNGELRDLKPKRKLLHRFKRAGKLRRRVLVKQVGKGVFSILIPALASLAGSLISG